MTDRSPLLPPIFVQPGASLPSLGVPEPAAMLLILGDYMEELILATSVIDPLLERWPRTQLWLLVGQEGMDLFRHAPGVAGILSFQRAQSGQEWALTPELARQLREDVRPDWTVMVPFSRDLLLDAFALAIDSKVCIGHLGDQRREPANEYEQTASFYSHLVIPPPEAGSELDRHRGLLEALGVVDPRPHPRVWVREQDLEAGRLALARSGLREGSFLAVLPGSEDAQRIYPHWAEVVQNVLMARPDLRVAVLGLDRDVDLGARIAEGSPGRAINLCGRLGLMELAGILTHASLVLASESALAHLACAQGARLMVVQGGGCFGRFLPYDPGTICVVNPLSCYGCDWSCIQERNHCVLDVLPPIVSQAILAALGRENRDTVPGLISQEASPSEGGPEALDLQPLLAADQVSFDSVPVQRNDSSVDFTLVVTSMNRPRLLDAMLQTVPAALAGASWELVGIHPGWDEETRRVFERHGAALTLKDEDHPGPEGGFSWSTLMNAGFLRARGRWIMYGSDDLLFEPEAIARAMAYGDLSGPRTGGVALLEHNPSRKDCPAWFIPMGYGRRPVINFGVIRREAFLRVGGFHDGFHFYCADFDLCSRIQAAGWEILPLWDARVRHNQVIADQSHATHESRHSRDRELMFARSVLYLPSLWPDGRQEYSDLTESQARAFAFRILETQVRTGFLRNPEPYGCRLAIWESRLPSFGALMAVRGMASLLQGGTEDSHLWFEKAALKGWTGPWSADGLASAHGAAEQPKARTTVFCAVWHKDPRRMDLLKQHQACLDSQRVPVERIYVFDGGDQPPAWLKGRAICERAPLTIYEAWARGIDAARTPYVMNLNLDDRLTPEAVALYEQVLDAGADLVGGDWRITYSQEETDAVSRSEESSAVPFSPAWPPPPGSVVRLGSGTGERGTLGPACAWRTSLHAELGAFPARFGDGSPIRVIGDLIWWRRVHEAGKDVRRLPVIVGRYHSHPGNQAEFGHSAEKEEWRYRSLGLLRDAMAGLDHKPIE